MVKPLLLAGIAAAFALASPAIAKDDPQEATAESTSAPEEPKKPKKVCHTQVETGSVMPKRVCRTVEEHRQEQAEQERAEWQRTHGSQGRGS